MKNTDAGFRDFEKNFLSLQAYFRAWVLKLATSGSAVDTLTIESEGGMCLDAFLHERLEFSQAYSHERRLCHTGT